MSCISQIFEAQSIKVKKYLVSINTIKHTDCSDTEWVVPTIKISGGHEPMSFIKHF